LNARRFLRRHGLTLVVIALFVTFWVAQAVTGYLNNNLEQAEHGQRALGFFEYLGSSQFWEATLENWESEFLQMGLYVILTAVLFQKGSAESHDPDARAIAAHAGGGGGGVATAERPPAQSPEQAEMQARRERKKAWLEHLPGPLRFLYEHSLSIALLSLFFACFAGHAASSWSEHNQQQILHGQPPMGLSQFMGHPQFWFESFQNWQSEFLAITAMVVLSIFLREKGSPESKDVEATNEESGEEA
jgi:hypothetical protein